MKRVGNLFEKMCSIENISLAHNKAKKGKRHYSEVKMVEANPMRYFKALQKLLLSGGYRTASYVAMVKQCSGKQRDIMKLPYYPDRIVHHCIVQVLAKVWYKSIIRDTFACIPGRGIHDGVRRIKAALRDQSATTFCLKMDAQKFYPSIDHAILKQIIRRKLKDRRVLSMIDEIIDSTRHGVPIGNYLSQHFGNLYLSGYDHWMKEVVGCRYYYRYCDDVVILHESKDRLHALRNATQRYWSQRLNLCLKSNWQVFPVDVRGIDFLGYRFFHGYTLLRKSIATRMKRRMKQVKNNWTRMAPESVVSSVMSYEGWMRHANCLNLKKVFIDADLQQIVKQLSAGSGKKNPLRRCVI